MEQTILFQKKKKIVEKFMSKFQTLQILPIPEN